MRDSDLPSLNGTVTNGLQLTRQLVRAIGSIKAVRARSAVEPLGTAALVTFLDAAKAALLVGKKPDRTPVEPTDPTDPTGPTDTP